ELRYAAILHDFGKVGVREHILTKANKLFPGDLALIRARFDFIKRTLELRACERKLDILRGGPGIDGDLLLSNIDAELSRSLEDTSGILAFIEACNHPTVLRQGGFDHLHGIAGRHFDYFGEAKPYLTAEEMYCLSIPRGSLTQDERLEIESHVTHTFRFLSTIPWTTSLKNVPLYAHRHHEKLDGTGYPSQVSGEQIPLQSRMMAICDIFDALTASDRPYKAAVPISKALTILEEEASQGKLDRHLLDIFIHQHIYRRIQIQEGDLNCAA
ncbi:MAG: phosphodiesterase, partial [Nitrospira sp.]